MPPGTERSVLHVLPHPGGGGDAYVDLLEAIPRYRFKRVYLGFSPRPSPAELARGVAHAMRNGRRCDVVHVHGEPAAGLCLPLLAVRPSFVTLHGLNIVRRVEGVRRAAARLNLRAVLRAADRTICVSESEHAELVCAAGTAAARRAVVVRNGVHVPPDARPDERRATRESLGITASETLAIWVGALAEHKDPLAAVRSAEQASVKLLVVGDGPLRSEVEHAASEQAYVLGERTDVPRLLSAADVFVLTSHHEGLSFSLLEAMAHGLAPVVTDLPENREAIGDAGLAIRTDDDSLSSTLRSLAGNPGERARLGERARRRVSELFTAAEMTRRIGALYDEVSASERSSAP